MRNKVLKIVATSAAMGISNIPMAQPPASAFEALGPGCHYPAAWDDDGLGLAYHSANFESNRANATGAAAILWNWSVTSEFVPTSWNYYMDLGITFAWMGPDWDAVAEMLAYCGSGGWASIPHIRWNLNKAQVAPRIQDKEVVIAVHEIGHAYGMDHNNNGGCLHPPNPNPAGYMYYDPRMKLFQCEYPPPPWGNGPQPDDIKGWGYLHP